MRGITKRFPRVLANDKVDFEAKRGEVHALVGENGAGKSTLLRILYGLEEADEGEARVHGVPLEPGDTAGAIRAGLGMVHQHFMLVPTFTVAENVVLGEEPGLGPFFARGAARRHVARLSEEFGLRVAPDARVEDLSVGEQQRVEILKVLYRGASVLILDEPTAVLTPSEVEELFRVLRDLRAKGKTIVLITHKLKEVMAVSDRVTVLRRGAVVGNLETDSTSPETIAQLMVGRPVLVQVHRRAARPGKVVLDVQNLSARSSRGLTALHEVSFDVREGEVLGIAGVEGNGQTELVQVLAGIGRPSGGRVLLDGKDVTHATPLERLRRGFARPGETQPGSSFAHVPEDRLRHGVVPDMTVFENAILGSQRERRFRRGLSVDMGEARTFAAELMKRLDVRPNAPELPVRVLSGGNQQKLVVARELAREPRCLLVAQLTRGVDVGAQQTIWQQVIDARDRGTAVLLVSAELAEVISLSDRIGVIYSGRLVKLVDARATDERVLGAAMAGLPEPEAPPPREARP
jgi:simple sugar transport system ATP-binding protein